MNKRLIRLAFFIFFVTPFIPCFASDGWIYLEIDTEKAKFGGWDEPEFFRFGLQAFDLNLDGYRGIESGRYYFLNPGSSAVGD